MHPRNQHVFIVRTVEDSDLALGGRLLMHAPEEVVELFCGRRFKSHHLAALRINPGHDVLDRAVLAAGVHAL
jgi:hypothetical protein